MKSFSILAPLLAAVSVSAHGFVSQITVDGKVYLGNGPTTSPPKDSVIRQIDDVDPVKGAMNPFINCGNNAQFATQVAKANPGSAVTFTWRSGANTNWPHNAGPVLTYMTSCGSTPCSQFNSTSAKWFKIAQAGQNSDGTWAQANIMAGGTANVTIPSTLAPGNYLIRHEIIALQLAVNPGGAEFYPSCSQVTVGGSQTGAPTESELALLPGAYKDTDPGIYDPTVYNPGSKYTFPGPPVAAFVSGGAAAATGSGNASATGAATSAASTATGTKPASSGTCRPKKKVASSSIGASATSATSTGSLAVAPTLAARAYHARRVSRIMRNW